MLVLHGFEGLSNPWQGWVWDCLVHNVRGRRNWINSDRQNWEVDYSGLGTEDGYSRGATAAKKVRCTYLAPVEVIEIEWSVPGVLIAVRGKALTHATEKRVLT